MPVGWDALIVRKKLRCAFTAKVQTPSVPETGKPGQKGRPKKAKRSSRFGS
jgi:hypothetical protein